MSTLLTIRQAAEFSGLSIYAIERMAQDGIIRPLTTPGGHRRFALDDLAKAVSYWMAREPHAYRLTHLRYMAREAVRLFGDDPKATEWLAERTPTANNYTRNHALWEERRRAGIPARPRKPAKDKSDQAGEELKRLAEEFKLLLESLSLL